MLFSGRAYYNLLWLQRLRGRASSAQEWEDQDYRLLPTEILFKDLSQLSLFFTKETFISFCASLDSPEELIQILFPEECESKNKVYLIIFELWRRLLTQKESVSIFADNLDRKIAAYEKVGEDSDLQSGLDQAVEILESNTILDEAPELVFERLCLYVAHDLESVIFTYVDSKISDESEEGCVHLIDHFMPYVKEKRALQFLKLKSLPIDFLEEREKLAEYLIHSLQESMNVQVSQSLLFYFIERRDKELFTELFAYLIQEVQEEKVLVNLLDVLVEYHRCFGREEKQNQVYRFLQKHLDKDLKLNTSATLKKRLLSFL